LTNRAVESSPATNFDFFDEAFAFETRLVLTLVNSKMKLMLTVTTIGMDIFIIFGGGATLRD
jgi:hypothetical protein